MRNVKKITFRIILLLFIVTVSFLHAQKYDPIKEKQFQHYKDLVNSTSLNLNENSEKLMEYAQTDYELSFANWIVGSTKYRAGEYLNAIFYLEKAEKYGKNSDSLMMLGGIVKTLTLSYRRAGLIEQSNDSWKRAKVISEKSNDPFKEAEYSYFVSKIYDVDEDYCKAADAKQRFLDLVPREAYQRDVDYIFATFAQVAFDNYKCGRIDAARKSIKEAESFLKQIHDSSSGTLYEIYLLTKALLYFHDKDIPNAKQAFDEAYKLSIKNDNRIITKLILEERLNIKIGGANEQLKDVEEVKELIKAETKTTQAVTKYESVKAKAAIALQKRTTKIWLSVSAVTITLLIMAIIFYTRRSRVRKYAYQKLIERLEAKTKISVVSEKAENGSNVKSVNREIENESEIIKRLDHLEEKKTFLSSDFSATKMAVLLKITPRNLSYLLKKYRGEDFYNYLNSMRVDYISKALKEDPALLKYKIAALSEMCGYSSHGQFTVSFKAKTGISPSQYIQFLQKENKASI